MQSPLINRIFATVLVVGPLALAACVEPDDVEPIEEESAELGADMSIDVSELLDGAREAVPEAAASLPPGCKAYANTPTRDGFNIEGGGNWYDCPATSRFRVYLKRHRSLLPDVTLAESSGTGISGWLRLFKSCRYTGSTVVYSEIRHENSGWKAQSQRLTIPCVF